MRHRRHQGRHPRQHGRRDRLMCPPVTLRQLYLKGKQRLTEAGLESPAFDALCLMQSPFGITDRAALALRGGEVVSPDAERDYLALIDRRLREPLQYILGHWDFDGLSLAVGQGVLVPREDTLALVEATASCLQGKKSPAHSRPLRGNGRGGAVAAPPYPRRARGVRRMVAGGAALSPPESGSLWRRTRAVGRRRCADSAGRRLGLF